MKRIICLLSLLMLIQISKAQVLLNLSLPTTGIYLKSQLWNFSIINSGNPNINVRIEMTFTDVANNQLVFKASSRVFQLTQQVTTLQATDLTPIIYNIINSSYNVNSGPDGFLPVGQFEVCFAAIQIIGESNDKIAEECDITQVEPLSPPILSEPGDEEVIDVLRPFFTWIPPSPAESFYNLTYDFVLVEVQSLQMAADAIQQNVPILFQQSLPVNLLLYPQSLPELDTSKLYAWQVAANSSNNAIAKSEIWTFRVRKYGLDTTKIISTGYYVPLKRENDASYATTAGVLRFEYLNEVNDSVASIRFYDITNTSRNVITPDSAFVKLRFGQNFIETDYSDLPGMIDKHIYLFELINSKDEKWYLKFEYRKPDNN